MKDDSLQQSGILGMHWGRRKGQSENNSVQRSSSKRIDTFKKKLKSIPPEKIALGKQIALATLAAGFAGVAFSQFQKQKKYKSIIRAMREPWIYQDVMKNISKYK